jgi:hypothetical protein
MWEMKRRKTQDVPMVEQLPQALRTPIRKCGGRR